MPTRSGKNYLKTKLCKCSKFYIYKDFGYKCSECFGYSKAFDYKTYEKDCNEWAINACYKEDEVLLLKQVSKKMNDKLLYEFIKLFRSTSSPKKYILAKDALEMYNHNPTLPQAHILASIVGDWWNINSKNTTWPPFCSCYYGNYDESIKGASIPLRLPHSMLDIGFNIKTYFK